MFQPLVMYRNICRDPNCREHGAKSQQLHLSFKYTDEKHDINLKIDVNSPPLIDILQSTNDLVRLLFLDDILPEEVRLVGFTANGPNGRYYGLNERNKGKSLKALGIVDGCTLHFKPTPGAKPPTPCQLTIIGPDESKKVDFTWFRAKTTLKALLEYVIEQFALQSVARERIHLLTICAELDLMRLDSRLSEMDVYDKMSIHVEIIPPLARAKLDDQSDILVKCVGENESFRLRVPQTETINELKLRIEKQCDDRRVADFALRNEAKEEISLTDLDRSLQSIGVKPGQTLFSTFRLKTRKNQPSSTTTENEASSTTISKGDTITVLCKFPSGYLETTRLSVRDTFGELMKYIDARTPSRRLVVAEIYSGGNRIHLDTDRTRCLADLGLHANDIVQVVTVDKSPVHTSIVSSRSSLSPELDRPRRSSSSTKRPIGLDNLGNSCYMNSAFQCLAHIPPLTDFFLKSIDRVHTSENGNEYDDWNPYDEIGEVTGAYADLLWNLWRCDEHQHDGNSFRPNRIKERMGDKDARFGTKDQHDAQEFMSFFLEIIHKELKEKNKNEKNTIIKQLFFGDMTSTIRCMACHRVESTTQPVSFLSIPLTRQERTFWINFIEKTGKNSETSVDVPMNGELSHVVEIFTDTMEMHSLFYFILAMLPDGEVDFRTPLSEIPTDELVFLEQEERSQNRRPQPLEKPQKASTLENCLEEFFSAELLEDGWTCQHERCKQKTIATKQLQLHTLPTILIIQFKRFSHENGLHQKIQTFVDYPIESLDLSKFLSRRSNGAIYDLMAVCNHVGSVSAGHYMAYARRLVAKKYVWYRFDDSCVTRVRPEDYNGEIISKNAYLLFYIKRDG